MSESEDDLFDSQSLLEDQRHNEIGRHCVCKIIDCELKFNAQVIEIYLYSSGITGITVDLKYQYLPILLSFLNNFLRKVYVWRDLYMMFSTFANVWRVLTSPWRHPNVGLRKSLAVLEMMFTRPTRSSLSAKENALHIHSWQLWFTLVIHPCVQRVCFKSLLYSSIFFYWNRTKNWFVLKVWITKRRLTFNRNIHYRKQSTFYGFFLFSH